MNPGAPLRPADSHASDLFLLTYNLSQMSNNAKILEIFLQSLQAVFPGVKFSYLPPNAESAENSIRIFSRGVDFGFISLEPSHPDELELSLIQNACSMLGLILQKNELAQEKQNTFRILFENMTQGVVYQDAKGNIISANPAAERILGLSLDQMQGRTSMNPEWKAMGENGEDLPGEQHPAMVALRTGKPVLNFIQAIYNPEIKAHVWMAVDSIPQFNADSPAPYQAISVFSDITLQRKAQRAEAEAVLESARRLEEAIETRKALMGVVEDLKKADADLSDTKAYLENLLDYANAPIIVWDNGLLIKRFNKAFERLTGVRSADALDKTLDFLFPAKTREASLQFIQSTAAQRWEAVELDIVDAKGDTRTLLWNSAMIYGPDGTTVLSTIAQGQDITERIRAVETAENLNMQLQELVNAVKSLSSAHSMEEIQKVASSAARALLRCDGAELLLREGDSYRSIGEPFPLENWISSAALAKEQIAVVSDLGADPRVPKDLPKDIFIKSFVVVSVNPDDPLAVLVYHWRREYVPVAKEIQLLQTLADAAAQAIQNIQLVDNLEKNVRLRTAELETAVKELESFSYSVSHDLRAPLRAIDGYVQILLEDFSGELDAEGTRVCNVISASARKMGRLIDDLLAFSRSGKASIGLYPIDMGPMANSIFHEITSEGLRDRIEFNVEKLPAALGDPSLIKQVWANLISNAIKFSSKKDHPSIAIRSERIDGETVYSISDNGAGFDMEYADKLFGVFQRLHSQGEFEGTGIGLAIVQRIIQRHGGRIWARAEPEKGAAFYFTLGRGESRHG